ncbi:MAG: exo-beta-N-acetylmuramidase NamZ domain-containing protein [Planctomyces sp.]
MTEHVRIGLEVLADNPGLLPADGRLGLLQNQASVDDRMRLACDVLAEVFPGRLQRLFSPQHGFWSEQQANMIESPDTRYEPLNLPVCSLYSRTRRPAMQQLRDLDLLLIDLQDVGTRVYTFVWTMLECLRACAEAGIPVCVLDRPNPLGGLIVEGPPIASGFESFVGNASVPMRHGLTMAELAVLLNRELQVGADVRCSSMEGWQRSHLWPDLGREWVPPSPNMPRWETCFVYPGQVLLEGLSLSEGRGTTRPFEICGAPGIVPEMLLELLNQQASPGLACRPLKFRPTFDKFAGQICGGLAVHVRQPALVRSFHWTLRLLQAVQQLSGNSLRVLDPPYEYEYRRPPLDILYGSAALRQALTGETDFDAARVQRLAGVDELAWFHRTADILLYD